MATDHRADLDDAILAGLPALLGYRAVLWLCWLRWLARTGRLREDDGSVVWRNGVRERRG